MSVVFVMITLELENTSNELTTNPFSFLLNLCFVSQGIVPFKMLHTFLLKRTMKTLYNNKILSIQIILMGRSCHLEEVSLGKIFLKIRSKFWVENPCQSAISIKSESNFVLITLEHGCSPVNLLHIFIFSRTTLDVCIWLGMI